MHQPQLSRQSSLQGLLAPQAPAEVGWHAKERKRRRGSNRRRGRSGQGSRRLKDEVIRLDAYQLKDNNDDALSEHLGTAMSFFLFLSFSLTFVYLANAPIKAPQPEHFSARGARGLYYPYVLFFTLSTLLLSYGETPSYPNKRAIHSFDLPYIALL